MRHHFLQRLDLDPTADERAIRRAYARELKKIDQETDPAGFQALRQCYEFALQWAKSKSHYVEKDEPEEYEEDVKGQPENQSTDAFTAETSAQITFESLDQQKEEAPTSESIPSARTNADEAFSQFILEFRKAANSIAVLNLDKVKALLEHYFASDLLINVNAREMFEGSCARLLAEGWKPEHELLFVACTQVFAWDADRRLGQRLGYFGHSLERALHERAVFDSQPNELRKPQRELIKRLRQPTEPTHQELLANIKTIEQLFSNFPNWLAMVTDAGKARHWHEQANALPAAIRQKYAIKPPKPTPQKTTESKRVPWFLILVGIGAIRALSAIVNPSEPYQNIPSTQEQYPHALDHYSNETASNKWITASEAQGIASYPETITQPNVDRFHPTLDDYIGGVNTPHK